MQAVQFLCGILTIPKTMYCESLEYYENIRRSYGPCTVYVVPTCQVAGLSLLDKCLL